MDFCSPECTIDGSGKVSHLSCTYKQLVQKTDGENKQPIRQFWEDNNIMNFDILLTMHLNVFILILTNLMH